MGHPALFASRLRQILTNPLYHPAAPGTSFWTWIETRIARWLASLNVSVPHGIFPWILALGAVLVLGGAVWVVASFDRSARSSRRARRQPDHDAKAASGTAADPLLEADRRFAQGDLRGAARLYFLAVIAHLRPSDANAGAWLEAATTGDILRAVDVQARVDRTALRRIGRLCDEIWYSNRRAPDEQAVVLQTLREDVRSILAPREESP